MKRAVATGVVLAIAIVGWPLKAEILEQILVKVNGDIITKTEFEQRQVVHLRQTNRSDVLGNDEALKRALVEITPQLIVEAVDELLLLQRGRELGYRLSDEQFTAVLENIKKENNINSEEQFQAALKQEGMTLVDLRRALEKQMVIARVQQVEVLGRINLTEEEERAYYRERPEEFMRSASVTLREILVTVPGATADGKATEPGLGAGINVGLEEEAKAKADRAHARITSGEDFTKVAAELSDAPSKANGGLVGPVDVADLAPALQKTLEGLQVGQVAPVLRTTRGFQLIRLESRSDAAPQPFEQVRAQIAEKIVMQRRRGEIEKYLSRLRSEAIIEWKNEDLKKAFDSYLEIRRSSMPTS
jgi:peptidyl-prolyl cis-trans isomerase SurA